MVPSSVLHNAACYPQFCIENVAFFFFELVSDHPSHFSNQRDTLGVAGGRFGQASIFTVADEACGSTVGGCACALHTEMRMLRWSIRR